MRFSNNFLFVSATILLGVLLVQKSEAVSIGADIGARFIAATKSFDAKVAVAGDGNIIIKLAAEAINKIEDLALLYGRNSPYPEAITILKDGWELSIKMVADVLDNTFDMYDALVGKNIVDGIAGLDAILKGMAVVQVEIFHTVSPLHSALGAARSIAKSADTGKLKIVIDKIQECANPVLGGFEAAQFLATQGFGSEDDEVSQKCFNSASSVIVSAAVATYTNLVEGAKTSFENFADSNKASLINPVEDIISEKVKAAAAADSDSVDAIAGLNEELEDAIKKGISAPILNVVKNGILQYIQHCALSVAVCYDAFAEAKLLAKTDPQAAIGVIQDGIKLAKSNFIDGIGKAYEGLGAAGKLSGLMNGFQAAIEIAEKSSVDGTKAMDVAENLVVTGIKTGGPAVDQGMASGHLLLDAVKSLMFEELHKCRDLAFQILEP